MAVRKSAPRSQQWRLDFRGALAAKADPALVDNTINTLTAAKVGRFIETEQTT